MKASPTTLRAGLFAIAALGVCLLCAWLLFGRARIAVLGAVFVLLNQTVYIQARIAMIVAASQVSQPRAGQSIGTISSA